MQSCTERGKQRAKGAPAQAPCRVSKAAERGAGIGEVGGRWEWGPSLIASSQKAQTCSGGLGCYPPSLSPFPLGIFSLNCVARFPESSWWLLSKIKHSRLQNQPLLVPQVSSGLVAWKTPHPSESLSLGWAPTQHLA